jgi:hypothetical protein
MAQSVRARVPLCFIASVFSAWVLLVEVQR